MAIVALTILTDFNVGTLYMFGMPRAWSCAVLLRSASSVSTCGAGAIETQLQTYFTSHAANIGSYGDAGLGVLIDTGLLVRL